MSGSSFLQGLVNPPNLPRFGSVVNARYAGGGLAILGGIGGIETLTDLVGAPAYTPGFDWLGVLGHLVVAGGAAACVLGGVQMYRGSQAGKAPAVFGLFAAVLGHIAGALAGQWIVGAGLMIVLILAGYYLVVISEPPSPVGIPVQTAAGLVIAFVVVGAVAVVVDEFQQRSTTASPGSTASGLASSCAIDPKYHSEVHMTLTGPIAGDVCTHADSACLPRKGQSVYEVDMHDPGIGVITFRITLENFGPGYPAPRTYQAGGTPKLSGYIQGAGFAGNGTTGTLTINKDLKSGTFDFTFTGLVPPGSSPPPPERAVGGYHCAD